LDLKINTRHVDDVTVVDAAGRIVLGEAARRFREVIQDLAEKGHKKIVVNLADVYYIDSSGTGELVAGCTSIIHRGGAMKLMNVTERVRGLLKITKLETVFQVFDNEASAVGSFGPTAEELQP